MPTATDATDETLMLGYRDGDAAAFDVLYGRHKGGIYRYLLRQCRNAALADELFQDVWMNLIRARAGYTVQAKFSTYLYRIAHNRLMDHFRRNDAGVSLDDESVSVDEPVAPGGAIAGPARRLAGGAARGFCAAAGRWAEYRGNCRRHRRQP
jgi:RNA polymerase sigma-70 factor (ECF subfamily)